MEPQLPCATMAADKRRILHETLASEAKRLRSDGDVVASLGTQEDSVQPAPSLSAGDVLVALRKLAVHIRNPAKFGKASKLALQLLEGGSVNSENATHMFQVLAGCMVDPHISTEQHVRTDYKKLFSAVKEHTEVFSEQQREQINVWLLWVELANELHTDDNFQFARAATRIKQAVEALPAATEEEDALAVASLQEKALSHVCSAPGSADAPLAALGAGEVKKEVKEEEVEHDPFGLGELLVEQKQRKREKRRGETDKARRAHEEELKLLRERREALLGCLTVAAGNYKLRWAQTVIDTLVKHAFDHITLFTAPQRENLEKLWGSVRDQMHCRKAGKSASGKLDVTAFERMQSTYASEKMSIRKAVGGGADRGTVAWLG